MTRTFALLTLAVLLTGCSKYGTRANGPFARQPRPNPNAPIPPGPPANNSPLALASDTQPEPPRPPRDHVVPPRNSSEPVALGNGFEPVGGVAPASAVAPGDAAFPPLRRRRPEPQPDQLPSPFAPKETPADPLPPPAQPVPQPPPADPAKTARPAGPAAPAAPAGHIAEVKKLAALAAEKWAKVTTYEAVVTRRELSPKNEMTDDVVVYQFRKEPMAVYIRNTDEANAGREIVYTQREDKIHAIVGKGDARFPFKAGSKAPVVTPDSMFVKDKSRYSIREAGYGTPIARVANWAAKVEAGKLPADALVYLGPVTRREFKEPVAGVQLTLRPGDDPLLPKGGTRNWFFDTNPESPAYGFPVLIIATEAGGREVEYYLFEKLRFGVPLTDADFSPDRFDKKR